MSSPKLNNPQCRCSNVGSGCFGDIKMTFEHAPIGQYFAFDRETQALRLKNINADVPNSKGDYTSEDMLREIIKIARDETQAVPDRLTAYQLMLNTAEFLLRQKLYRGDK